MGKTINFTLKEIDKLNLSKYIQKLFFEYTELYIINICIQQSSIVEKGKKIEVKKSITANITFKYGSFFCAWFNGGAYTSEKYENLFSDKENQMSKIIQHYKPINFYLQLDNKKITYDEFESGILTIKELQKDKFENIFGENQKIKFCRERLNENINDFLGIEILSKQYAQELNKNLSNKFLKEKYIKI